MHGGAEDKGFRFDEAQGRAQTAAAPAGRFIGELGWGSWPRRRTGMSAAKMAAPAKRTAVTMIIASVLSVSMSSGASRANPAACAT